MNATDSSAEFPLRVGVLGLWHLGCVTAAACASVGHRVIGLDPDAAVVANFNLARAPIAEPGLDELIASELRTGRLRALPSSVELPELDLLWVAFDTPVDDEDQADLGYVIAQVQAVLPKLLAGTVVLVSSQMPIGSSKLLEDWAKAHLPQLNLQFAVSPENLRLGGALKVFLEPDRVVMGCRNAQTKALLTRLTAPITSRVEWMSNESAEMSKHAINAFLAMSVTFANEIATLCEKFGADAKDVARSMKTETRIGPKAYVGPGAAFAGGTLARDIAFLNHKAQAVGLQTHVLSAVRPSNNQHRNWARNKLVSLLGNLQGKTIALWGLTYKPGTNTLRRSMAVELGDWLLAQGALLQVHDPAVTDLPANWGAVKRAASAADAAIGAHALVLCTAWPEYNEPATKDALAASMSRPLIVLDADRSLKIYADLPNLALHAVGTPEVRA